MIIKLKYLTTLRKELFLKRSVSTNLNNYALNLFDGLIQNKRSDLARSITLIETSNNEKKKFAQVLLNKVLERIKENKNNNKPPSIRIGITGPPGAGKSSLIEIFGKFITTKIGAKVAVLTIDPSSSTTGGSILGDKVRMPQLAIDPLAYIRSSPNKCTLGGVTRNTLETIFVCEAANYDVILVETVGVGQAEHDVLNMVDCMVLLIPPGSGDELQGLKKGIAELADIVAVTKYDDNLKLDAIRVKREYMMASQYIRKKSKFWSPKVILTSAALNIGIDELWNIIMEFKNAMLENNVFHEKRQNQAKHWFWNHLKDTLFEILLSQPELNKMLEKLEFEVMSGNITPGQASDIIIKKLNLKKD